MINTTIVECETNIDCERNNRSDQGSELGQSLASDRLSIVSKNEEQQTVEPGLSLEVVRMSEAKNDNEKYITKSDYHQSVKLRLTTSVALLSCEEIDLNQKIERIMSKNQSVAEHSLRMKNLSESMAECGTEIVRLRTELGENAWIDRLHSESDIECFCTVEEILLEMLETALNSVSVEEIPAKTEAKLGKGKRMLDEIVMIDSM